jgi:hypothetical protein
MPYACGFAKLPQSRTGISTLHHLLAYKKCVESGELQANKVVVRTQSRLTHGNAIIRNGLGQFERRFHVHLKVAEVSIVDANDSRACRERAFEFLS